MSRRTERQTKNQDTTPLDKKKSALSAEADQLKEKLQQARRFLQDAPNMKAEAQRKEQQELLNRFRRPARVEGPSDFRLELVNGRGGKPRTLRRERSLVPMLTTVFLLLACGVVLYYAVRVLQHG